MSKRKGELTSASIDRRWPHQVALHSGLCIEDQFRPLHDLAHILGAAPRGRSVTKREPTGYENTHRLFCFATRDAAQAFIDRAGGRHFNPATDRDRPKHPNCWTWREWGDPVVRYFEIVARLERVRSWEPDLDADICMLLGAPRRVAFTKSKRDVEAYLAKRIPTGSWESWTEPEIDARVRPSADAARRHARENRTRPRDSEATALTLAFLRSIAVEFSDSRQAA